ncbi:MAG: sulfatase-like hydrolase/transferase, partial [Candidatus Sumerlaeota bacterium]|nr:sulfatase-like hydrolase/transferase [Candidatus Sumerlaeota bacterium]
VTPQCSPARSTMMTGLYPHQTGVVTNTDKAVFGKPLPTELPCVGKVFQAAGYRAGYFGKWHLSGSRGAGLEAYGFPGYELGGDKKIPEQAKKFFEAADERPWMLWLSFLNPHDIYHPDQYPALQTIRPDVQLPRTWNETHAPDSPIGKLRQEKSADAGSKEESLKTYRSFYAGLMEIIDKQLGEILDSLEAAGQAKNTIIMYFADHGDMGGAHSLRFKGSFPYEEVLHIPLVIGWPGQLPRGETRSALTSQVDIIPTLCDLTGVQWPTPLPGQSVVPLIRDPKAKGRDCVYADYFFQNIRPEPYRLIRTDRYKLCEYLDGGVMLFDMEKDPDETTDLAGKPEAAEVQKELHERLTQWRKQTNDPLLDPEKLKEVMAQQNVTKATAGKAGAKAGAKRGQGAAQRGQGAGKAAGKGAATRGQDPGGDAAGKGAGKAADKGAQPKETTVRAGAAAAKEE